MGSLDQGRAAGEYLARERIYERNHGYKHEPKHEPKYDGPYKPALSRETAACLLDNEDDIADRKTLLSTVMRRAIPAIAAVHAAQGHSSLVNRSTAQSHLKSAGLVSSSADLVAMTNALIESRARASALERRARVSSIDSARATRGNRLITSRDVSALVRGISQSDETVERRFIASLIEQGVSIERIATDLIEVTAQTLGLGWVQDTASFVDVTLGCARLAKLVHELDNFKKQPITDQSIIDQTQARMFLATVPGNQHSLGIQTFDMLLRREGVSTVCQIATNQAHIAEAVRTQYFDAAGFSIGSDLQLSSLTAVVAATRAASKNKNIIIFAGGPLLANSPASAQISGVDLIATDATAALQELRRLLRLAAPNPSP